ncbi:MAG: hypothetical protein DRJ01_15985 [Bacteroidetes bacterium]|nr:MAG: hypothetical protein DRJ01_15985 [Bacteroidota bacterium]
MVFLIILSAGIAIWVYFIQQGKDVLAFTISVVSFSVALLALYISAKTYASIDSVNNISKMEGNILENQNYVTSIPELILEFKDDNEKKLDEAIFTNIENKLKNESKTAVQFADTLQYLIDLIVFFPAVFNAKNTDKSHYNKRMKSILTQIDKQRDFFKNISKGNSIQIDETIKLFKGVISYQAFVSDNNFNVDSALLHVRGPILSNPVTKTIYHNYLGLFYNKKAMHLIKDDLQIIEQDILSIKGLNEFRNKLENLKPHIKEKIIMYLESADAQFDKALSASVEDVMWLGFINYNKARTLYFLSSITNQGNLWTDTMYNAISARTSLNNLIEEILSSNKNTTHLKTFFIFQEELARLVNLNLLFSLQKDDKNLYLYRGYNLNTMKDIITLKSMFVNIPSFEKIKKYQNDLYTYLKSNKTE